MKDAQKAYKAHDVTEGGEKLYIPEAIEESDSKSDSFGERLRKLNDEGQTSKQTEKHEQMWFVHLNDINTTGVEQSKIPVMESTHVDSMNDELLKKQTQKENPESPEIFITDDNIFIHKKAKLLMVM